jgi:hypothetical protein
MQKIAFFGPKTILLAIEMLSSSLVRKLDNIHITYERISFSISSSCPRLMWHGTIRLLEKHHFSLELCYGSLIVS